MTPTDMRVAAGDEQTGGQLAPDGVTALKKALNGNAQAFADWRREAMTRLVARAIQHLAVHTPRGLSSDHLLVQCGITQGLELALQVINDPSAVWMGVFGGAVQGIGQMPDLDFSTSLDDMMSPETKEQ